VCLKSSITSPSGANLGWKWSFLVKKTPQVDSNAEVPSDPHIPLIVRWVPKQGGASVPAHKGPTLITPLPPCPLGAWEKFFNIPESTNLGRKWPFLLPQKTKSHNPQCGQIRAKNGQFWSKNKVLYPPQIGPKIVQMQGEALTPAHEGPTLITPLPPCPLGAWKQFYNLPNWTNLGQK